MAETNVVKKDIAILGAGPAGYVAAIRAAQLGASVALIEERDVGGTCLNRGCIPTKALLRTSEVAYLINKCQELGLNVSLSSVNWEVANSRKERVVKNLRMGLEYLLKHHHIEIIRGTGKIQSPHTILVETLQDKVKIECNKLLITTGSEPLELNIPGIHLENVINSDAALDLAEVPQNIVIIGGGAVGIEFASIFNSVGSKVTVIETAEHILPHEDQEITAELLKIMKRQGIGFKLNTSVSEIKENENTLEVHIEQKGKSKSLNADKVLVAVGRKLNTVSEDILSLGVQVEKGAIVVNEKMETTVKDVYAAGDVIGGKLLAHLAFAEGRVAVQNALGFDSQLNYDAVPACVYSNPEVASVGINEAEAKRRGIEVKVGSFQFRNNGKALCMAEREGFVKVIVAKDTDVVLGAQILGPHATEMISEMTLAVTLKVKADVVAGMIHPHPTLSEAIMEACGDAIGRSIHKA